MVFSRKYIQRMEIRWFVVVDTWETYVTVNFHHATTPDHLDSVAGSGKSILWFVLL